MSWKCWLVDLLVNFYTKTYSSCLQRTFLQNIGSFVDILQTLHMKTFHFGHADILHKHTPMVHVYLPLAPLFLLHKCWLFGENNYCLSTCQWALTWKHLLIVYLLVTPYIKTFTACGHVSDLLNKNIHCLWTCQWPPTWKHSLLVDLLVTIYMKTFTDCGFVSDPLHENICSLSTSPWHFTWKQSLLVNLSVMTSYIKHLYADLLLPWKNMLLVDLFRTTYIKTFVVCQLVGDHSRTCIKHTLHVHFFLASYIKNNAACWLVFAPYEKKFYIPCIYHTLKDQL